MTVGFSADNEKKVLLENFCIAYKNILQRYHLVATQATAQHIEAASGLKVEKLLPGDIGGARQMENAIMSNDIDVMIVFGQTSLDLSSPPKSVGRENIRQLCDFYNVPVATNIATAECLILALDRGDLDWREQMKN